MSTATLSAAAARRVALAAQGFAEPRPPAGARLDAGHVRRVVERIGLLQIDSVNVLARAHYLPLFSRLGAYPRALLEAAAWGRPKRLFEYWAHEASLLPLDLHPLLRWRMAAAERGEGGWGRVRAYARERRGEAEALLARVEAEGPLAASDLEGPRGPGGWWGWSDAKTALEWLFWSGRLATATRRSSFERVYDLPERVLPRAVLNAPTPEPADAHRALLLRAARALGVATAGDLRDYPPPVPRPGASAPARARGGGRTRPRAGGGLEPPRLFAPGRAPAAGGWRRGRCWPPSIRWCGRASAPSACSACATGWRSTRPPLSASTATTCCRSCWASGWSRAWT